MNDHHNDPIISGPEPSGLSVWWRNLVSALSAMRAKGPTAAAPEKPKPRGKTAGRRPPGADEVAEARSLKAWRETHGAPAIWMAPLFLAFAFVFAFPHLARMMEPQAPRAMIAGLVGALPEPLAPLSAMMAGWLWLPWWIALPSLLFRLRAAWVTRLAMLDAVGWSMAALVIDGGAWLFFGRKALEAGGFSLAERSGAWQLLAAEFIFLFLTAVMFGPTSRQRVRFEQS